MTNKNGPNYRLSVNFCEQSPSRGLYYLSKQLTSVVTRTSRVFCACILADPKDRGQSIKLLRIDRYAFQATIRDSRGISVLSSDVSNFAQVIQHCCQLHSLMISRLEAILKAEPSFGIAIADLENLTTLRLLDVVDSSPITDLLCSMRSKLRTLGVDMSTQFIDGGEFQMRHPSELASTASVEVFEISNMIFPPRSLKDSPWPSVRRFKTKCGDIDPSILPRIFPNLRECQISDMIWSSDREGAETAHWPQLASLEIQPLLVDVGSWPACLLGRLSLPYPRDYLSNGQPDYRPVHELMRQCRPVMISVEHAMSETGTRALISQLPSLAPPTALPGSQVEA